MILTSKLLISKNSWPNQVTALKTPILSDMNLVKNLNLEDAAAYMGLPEREILLLAKRGEIVRIKRDGEFVYRIKVHPNQVAPQPTLPVAETEPIQSPENENGFLVLRDAHQSATALVRRLEQDNRNLKEEYVKLARQNRRSRFRWKVAAVTCAITILLLGSALIIARDLYQGRSRDLLEAQNTLAVTTDHLQFKIDTAQQQAQNLRQQLDQTQVQQHANQKQIETERQKLDRANTRIEQLSRAVLELLHNQDNRSDSPLL